MKKEINDAKQVKNTKNTYKIFFGLAVIMIIYMGFSAITSYQSYVEYCDAYHFELADQWFKGLQTILAAVVPCLVYATLSYGIGYIIKSMDQE